MVQHLLEAYVPLSRKWLVLFPEGGFLRKRKAVSHRYAEKMNLPKFENVSLPRVGAMQIIMDTLARQTAVNNNSNIVESKFETYSLKIGNIYRNSNFGDFVWLNMFPVISLLTLS